MEQSQLAEQVIVAVVGAIVLPAMEWLRRKLVRGYRRLKLAIERIDIVYAELTPDGGGSVKDKVN